MWGVQWVFRVCVLCLLGRIWHGWKRVLIFSRGLKKLESLFVRDGRDGRSGMRVASNSVFGIWTPNMDFGFSLLCSLKANLNGCKRKDVISLGGGLRCVCFKQKTNTAGKVWDTNFATRSPPSCLQRSKNPPIQIYTHAHTCTHIQTYMCMHTNVHLLNTRCTMLSQAGKRGQWVVFRERVPTEEPVAEQGEQVSA